MSPESCFPFFVGRGRSGTTLLRSMFDSHPEMAIPYESHFPVAMGMSRSIYEKADGFDTEQFLADLFAHFAFKRWGIPEDEVRNTFLETENSQLTLADALRLTYRTYARHHGKERYGEKTPGFVVCIPLLAALFPESRFIHVIRDGRNVALSYLDGGWGPKNLVEAAMYWKRFVQKGRRDGQQLGSQRYTEVRYEHLVEDPETELRRLCSFIGLDLNDQMMRYFDRRDVVPSRLVPRLEAAHQNLLKPPTPGLRDWRRQLSSKDAALFDVVAGDLLQELGYERASEGITAGTYVRAAAGWVGVQKRRAMRRARRFTESSFNTKNMGKSPALT
jgi:hypothetical protein